MERHLLRFKAHFWDARLSPLLLRVIRPIRRFIQQRWHRVLAIDVDGVERLRPLLNQGAGLLLTPNHAGHADPFVLAEAADLLCRPFHFMTAWQVFAQRGWFGRRMLQHYGCFSVDREGTDLRAFKRSVQILTEGSYPLVIFPEGEVYHVNDRITPFREGPAVIALTAIKQCNRPIYAAPCAIKYQYLQDPTPALVTVMAQLEQRIFWRPQTNRPLAKRIYAFAEAVLGLKEKEYLNSTQPGGLPQRVRGLMERILAGLESVHGLSARGQSVPERVKTVRRTCLEKLETHAADPRLCAVLRTQLDDAFFVVQLFSYPGDYVAERPSIERLAETVDKFEEDVLGRFYAGVRGTRRAVLEVGQPIDVRQFAEGSAKPRKAAGPLTDALEKAVQGLLTGINVRHSRQ